MSDTVHYATMYSTRRSTPTAYADFNMADASGHVPVAMTDLRGLFPVDVDEWLRLVDEDGNQCEGRVVEVAPRLFTVELDWATWRSAEIFRESVGYTPPPDGRRVEPEPAEVSGSLRVVETVR
jgi:hypothetical protein